MTEETTAPVLTHARFMPISGHDGGVLHAKQKDVNGNLLKTVGWVRGTGIAIGQTVQVMKNRNKGWEGTVKSGPHLNQDNQEYWQFEVESVSTAADPGQDNTITVTVTDPGPPAQSSNPPQVSDPQPDQVP
jgi:hypothetical protein